MSTCNGCNSRLRRPVGSSGYCDPCWLVVQVERLVFTRCPPHTVGDLTEYLKTVTATLERTCEKFEADRAAGFVKEDGEPIPGARERILASRAGKGSFEQGIHRGEKDKEASSIHGGLHQTASSSRRRRKQNRGRRPWLTQRRRGQQREKDRGGAGDQRVRPRGQGRDIDQSERKRRRSRGRLTL